MAVCPRKVQLVYSLITLVVPVLLAQCNQPVVVLQSGDEMSLLSTVDLEVLHGCKPAVLQYETDFNSLLIQVFTICRVNSFLLTSLLRLTWRVCRSLY
jgi:hypothetical protein